MLQNYLNLKVTDHKFLQDNVSNDDCYDYCTIAYPYESFSYLIAFSTSSVLR